MANAWGKIAEKQKVHLVYISDETKTRGEIAEFYKNASNGMLEVGEKIMESNKEKGLLTTSTTKEGKEYTDKAVVNVAPLEVYNKETGENEYKYDKNGEIINLISLTIPYNSQSEKLTLYAKNDISEGIVLQNMVVSKYTKEEGAEKGTFKFYKEEEIADAPISDNIKAIAKNIQDMDLIVHKEITHTPLQKFSYEMNQKFNEFSEKVVNDDNKLVNDAYAKYRKDEYGEKVELRNHQDNIVVVVGFNKENKPYATAYNFDITLEDGRPAFAPIKTVDDYEEYDIHQSVRCAINEFNEMAKNLEQEKEQGNKEEKKVEKPKKSKSDNEMELD